MIYSRKILVLILAMLTFFVDADGQARKTIREGIDEISGKFDVRFVYDSSLDLDKTYRGRTDKTESLTEALETVFDGSGIVWTIEKEGHVVLARPQKPIVLTTAPEPHRHDTLTESRIVSDRHEQKIRSSLTGLERMDGKAFDKGFAVLSSPDVIKTLQTLPGVSAGTELISGLHVHGGTGHDNLFLLDGVPLYSVSHLAGLFSSFNTDVIETLDFYKSGFPARFGGRMSSVVDITTRDGDPYEYHGTFSIGLLDGRAQFEGPIVKGKTSFNVAMRRSWIDVLSEPVLGIYNATQEDYNVRLHYALTDLNAKITHLFSPDNRISANFYYGNDRFKYGEEWNGVYDYGTLIEGSADLEGEETMGLKWGNILASLNWQNRISDGLTSEVILYYTQFNGEVANISTDWDNNNGTLTMDGWKENHVSTIRDLAAKADFRWQAGRMNDIRFGVSYQHHDFTGERIRKNYESTPDVEIMNQKGQTSAGIGHEASVYIEDEFRPAEWFSANLGARYVMFNVPGKTYHRIEPRASLGFMICDKASIKASYTEMNQFAHNIAASYLDLPTNIWMPATAEIAPLHSKQMAAGIYLDLPAHLTLDIEGYFKTMEHLREYTGAPTLYPPIDRWEDKFTEGKGRSYGGELTIGWNTENTSVTAAYTLSWNMRKFDLIWTDWYPDRFDNRHKITVSASHRFSDRFDIYASWNFHSGNRMTVETVHSEDRVVVNSYLTAFSPMWNNGLYEVPNNLELPDYHRLDIGMNFRKETKRGNERIWNISVYNAYCRLNPVFAVISTTDKITGETLPDGQFHCTGTALIPILPSFSYTLKF